MKDKIIEKIKTEIKKRHVAFELILNDETNNKMPLFNLEDAEKRIWGLNKMLIEELEKEVSQNKI